MTTLIALKSFSPDGSRQIKKNEKFTMSDSSARFLIATKRAKLALETEHMDHGKYKRRDMRATD